jgi:hypothetical protein
MWWLSDTGINLAAVSDICSKNSISIIRKKAQELNSNRGKSLKKTFRLRTRY